MTRLTSAWGQPLLTPRSVALVGVSDDPAKTSGRPLQFLQQAGFSGTIYPVNPRRQTVQGLPAWPDLAALPEVPDHVFILTEAESALDALDECTRLGVPVATVLAGGFAELGEAGAANQRRLADIVARGGTRVLGPSSIGLVNLHHSMPLTANAAFAETGLPRGGVFVGSHSGSLIGALASRGRARGVGFAGLVSVGSECDLTIGEICAATLDDPAVTGYLLFLETMRGADWLRRFAVEAARRGKPIAVYKLGRSTVAAELAVTHTGALAGEDRVADAFLRDCGMARVESFDGLLEILPLLSAIPILASGRAPRVGVVTTTGGGAAMAVDQMAIRGVDVIAPSVETRIRLGEAGISDSHGRIVDLTLAGTRYEVMKAALDVMLSASEFDMVLATVGSSARFNPELAVRPVIDAAMNGGCPLAAFIVPDAPQAVADLRAAGVAVFTSPEICGDAVASAFARRAPRDISERTVPQGPANAIDEAEAYRLFAAAGIAHAPFAILSADEPAHDPGLGWPVVAKVLDASISHKSDVGGVVLNIADLTGLQAAVESISADVSTRNPATGARRILVQPMVKGLGELLLGYRHDPEIGPLVMLAAGGTATELYQDTALRLAPVDLSIARSMIEEVQATRLLRGFRGKPEGDLEAVAQAIVAFSRLAVLADYRVREAEINPLIVRGVGQGVLAVDGLALIDTPT